jgi:hypothetical protein
MVWIGWGPAELSRLSMLDTAVGLSAGLLGFSLLALLAAAVILRRRPRRASDEIEYLFLATSAATRKEREISDIDAFARKVGASVEELKSQLRRLRTGHYQQVKIYIDHSNFITSWTQAVHARERPYEHDIDWSVLPRVLLAEVGAWLTQQRKAPPVLVYRGTNVYGTLYRDDYFALLDTMLRLEKTSPDKLPLPIRFRKETVERWRSENAAQKGRLAAIKGEIGYHVVPIYRRTPRVDQLADCNFNKGGIPIAPEKMLDTYIATDLIADAMYDVYDIALLLSEDSDFIPVVQFVQDMRGKTVIHVGFGGHKAPETLRAVCRHSVDLTKGGSFQRLRHARETPAASGAGARRSG